MFLNIKIKLYFTIRSSPCFGIVCIQFFFHVSNICCSVSLSQSFSLPPDFMFLGGRFNSHLNWSWKWTFRQYLININFTSPFSLLLIIHHNLWHYQYSKTVKEIQIHSFYCQIKFDYNKHATLEIEAKILKELDLDVRPHLKSSWEMHQKFFHIIFSVFWKNCKS